MPGGLAYYWCHPAMQPPTSSFDLVEQVKAGDQQAFTRLFHKCQRRLAVLIHFKLSPAMRGKVEVDDILQETLLRGYRDLEHFTYRGPGSFLRWLQSIAEHVIIDAARYQGRDRRAAAEVPLRSESNPLGPEPADSHTPRRLLRERESVDALLDRLNALPEDYREVILLAKIEELSTTEIAERLGKSREAVAVLLFRALKRFRALLSATEP